MPHLLSIDDDRSVHHLVKKVFEDLSVDVSTALTASEGIEQLQSTPPDVVLLDVMLPDMSGLEAFRIIREHAPRVPIVIATAASGSDTAIEAMKLGAFDYLTKPFNLGDLERLVSHAIESYRLSQVPVGVEGLTKPEHRGDVFVGRCAAMQDVFKSIGRVAPQNVPVLIRGESGTGKELVARAIYQHSDRSDGPFLAVNCAALSETLLESELFGHEKGSFTGAHDRRIGKFEQCDGGTLFLDEVGDMAPLVQGKVLRLLQQKTFERVGGAKTLHADVRIVSATNRDLEKMCENGEFRTDLFYRLNGYSITLPPLRERGDDKIVLLQHFLAVLNKELGRSVEGVAPEAMERLLAYPWPGNVREMQSVLKQTLLHTTGPVLMASALPAEISASAVSSPAGAVTNDAVSSGPNDSAAAHPPRPVHENDSEGDAGTGLRRFISDHLASHSEDLYAKAVQALEKELLAQVLTRTGGNQSEASRLLGITRGSLRNKIRALGITIDPHVHVDL